jgi:membrane protease YdiL (CAAX protease family)
VTVYAVAVRIGERRTPRELGPGPALPGLAAGAVLGLLLMALLMGALAAANLYDVQVLGIAPAWAGAGLALQAAITEELWTRALLLRLLWRVVGPVPAFVVVALTFGALHLSNPGATPLAAATVAMAGLMFSALYALTGRLWVPIGLHFAWNLTQGYVFGADVSGAGFGQSIAVSTPNAASAQWLTGGVFGPEASTFALIIVTVVTGCTLFLLLIPQRAPAPVRT